MPLVTRIPTGYDALTGEVRAWDWREVLTTEIRETMKVLIATEKPFAQKAVDGIRRIVEEAGYELALLEKYTDKAQLLEAVADVDALIIRSDKVTAESARCAEFVAHMLPICKQKTPGDGGNYNEFSPEFSAYR